MDGFLPRLTSSLWIVNTRSADANGYKFSHPGLDPGFTTSHGFDLDTYRSAVLDQTTQHEVSEEAQPKGKHQLAYI